MHDRKHFILNEKFSIDEKFSKFEKLMENEQKYQTNLNHQLKKQSENLFLLNNEILLLRKHEKEFDINIQAYINQMRNIRTQINKFDQQLLKQQEFIYHQDFLKQTTDRRLNRMLGEKSNEKYSESDLKIRELRKEYETKKNQYDQLEIQLKIVNEELRIIKRDFDQLAEGKNLFHEKFLQFDLYTSLSEKLTKKLNTEKEVQKYAS
jgi:hypothetical protein